MAARDDAALAAICRSDDGLPAQPGDDALIAEFDAACRAAQDRYDERVAEQAAADYRAWWRLTFGDPIEEDA